jgi:hypothetical protein
VKLQKYTDVFLFATPSPDDFYRFVSFAIAVIAEQWHPEVRFAQVSPGLNPVSPDAPATQACRLRCYVHRVAA